MRRQSKRKPTVAQRNLARASRQQVAEEKDNFDNIIYQNTFTTDEINSLTRRQMVKILEYQQIDTSMLDNSTVPLRKRLKEIFVQEEASQRSKIFCISRNSEKQKLDAARRKNNEFFLRLDDKN